MAEETPKVSVSIQRKINIGNYESVDVFLAVSGVEAETHPDDIEAALDAGEVAYEQIAQRIVEKTKQIQKNRGGE